MKINQSELIMHTPLWMELPVTGNPDSDKDTAEKMNKFLKKIGITFMEIISQETDHKGNCLKDHPFFQHYISSGETSHLVEDGFTLNLAYLCKDNTDA